MGDGLGFASNPQQCQAHCYGERDAARTEVAQFRTERDEALARARRAEADVHGAWNAYGMVFDELNRTHAALKDAQVERDEAREQLAKAYDVIAWMKALPGVSHLMAVSLLRGGR